ncbi:S1C family serine protease [Actinoplanes sp. N902-109]|uniref:S1C family serine protease n=1 Tax=Actinoplanes sp. (strain N902-109) TaxID=649831 RepID=UPI0003294AE6|nr:trypsin-like peptidase domain-containing protein [Actinoplanes sp. N902-109]AGL18414.1 peptidase S1 and S6, chymotrypsin/Hap [Actinoplanes sp. N902-109]
MTDLMTRPPLIEGATDQVPPLPPVAVSHRGAGGSRWPRRIAGGAALLALIGGGGAAGAVVAEHYASGTPAAASATTATTAATTRTTGLATIAAKVSPSIVTVMIDGRDESALGSGVVLSADGLVLTNNHVISSGGTVSVRLSDGRTVPAQVVATDPTHDLALVQASGLTGLTPATFGTDDSVAVGDTVLAFGAPLGLEGTVTSGIVSALDREVNTGTEKLTGLLQTDAAINEGNSGGALVDTSGKVIGINVAIATADDRSTGSVGLGFAIPAGTATQVVQQLRSRTS